MPTEVTDSVGELENAMRHLLQGIHGEDMVRAQDPVDMYAGNGQMHTNGRSDEPREMTAVETTDHLTDDAVKLLDTGKRHVKSIEEVVGAQIDEHIKRCTELRDELRTRCEERNEADKNLVTTAHKIMTTLPHMALQIHDLATAVRRVGGE